MSPATIFPSLLFLLASTNTASGLKVLHFAAGTSSSHLIFDYRLANTSASHGHNVTMWTYLATTAKLSKTVTLDPKIREILVDLRDTEAVVGFQQFMDITWNNWDLSVMVKFVETFGKVLTDACRFQFDNSSHLIEELRHELFDLAVMPAMDACQLVIAHFAGVPVQKMIMVSPAIYLLDSVAHSVGFSANPSYIPNIFFKFTDKMTFTERIVSALMGFNSWFPANWIGWGEQMIMFQEPPYSENPSLLEAAREVPYVILSGEQSLDFPRPLTHGLSYLGQMSQHRKTTKLPENYEKIFKTKNKGVILVSFGSLSDASTMPQKMKLSIVNALGKFTDYSIIWKFDAELPEIANYSHIHRVSWMPQREMLLSGHIKVFVTHCGFNSLLETVKTGVPMVLCPLFADQDSNALRAVNQGIGVLVNIKNEKFTADVFESQLRTVLEDKKYAERAKNFAAILNDRVISSEEEFLHKIKMVSKFPGRLPSSKNYMKLNFLQYFCLDVVVMVYVPFVFAYYVTVKV